VELPKIPSVVGLQGPSRRRKTFRGLKGLRCVLVDYSKIQGWLGTSKSSRKREMFRIEEVWYSLVELSEITSVVWIQGSSRKRKTFWWLKRLRCALLELPKIPWVVWTQGSSKGRKTFRWLNRLGCKLVELHGVVGSKGNSSNYGWC